MPIMRLSAESSELITATCDQLPPPQRPWILEVHSVVCHPALNNSFLTDSSILTPHECGEHFSPVDCEKRQRQPKKTKEIKTTSMQHSKNIDRRPVMPGLSGGYRDLRHIPGGQYNSSS